MSSRRVFLKTAGNACLLSLADLRTLLADQSLSHKSAPSLVNIIIPRNYTPPIGSSKKNYSYKLTNATLTVLKDNFTHTPMPVWRKTYSEIDFEKRVTNIVYWVMEAISRHQKIYPLDPAWIVAQIMKESYFYEFAISQALAVGICQFIQPTAQEYNMLCAGEKSAHRYPPYKLGEFAEKAREYYRLREERSNFRRSEKPRQELNLEEALHIIHTADTSGFRKTAGEQLNYMEKLREFDEKVLQTREDYREYLLANLENRNIFDDNDLSFILNFDERVTYKKPVFAMVEMVAKGLRARSGNILAAAAGYNAGLYSTLDDGMYKPYGRIPPIEQSTTYLSHVLINYYEICKRLT